MNDDQMYELFLSMGLGKKTIKPGGLNKGIILTSLCIFKDLQKPEK